MNHIFWFILSSYLLTECDSCTLALLVDLERMDDALARLKQQLQNMSETKVQLMQVLVICV